MNENRQVVYADTLEKILHEFIVPSIEDAVGKRMERFKIELKGYLDRRLKEEKNEKR